MWHISKLSYIHGLDSPHSHGCIYDYPIAPHGSSVPLSLLQCALETQYWTWINHLFTWGSIALFMFFQVVMYADRLTFMDFFYEYMGVTPQVRKFLCM